MERVFVKCPQIEDTWTWPEKSHELRNEICVLLNKRCLPA